jgi:hypothetical protein
VQGNFYTSLLTQETVEISTMSNAEEVEVIRARIQHFRSLGEWDGGHEFFTNLPETLRTNTKVIIEIAQLYLVQGFYIRAWDICNSPNFELFESDESSAQSNPEIREDTICLALLSAFIGISRHGRLKTALHVALRVQGAYLAQSNRSALKPSKDPAQTLAGASFQAPVISLGVKDSSITGSRQQLTLQDFSSLEIANSNEVSESRVGRSFRQRKLAFLLTQ